MRDLVDGNGALQDHRTYDGFGNLTAKTNPSFGDRYGYTGREFEAEVGLQYNRARSYDPRVGRWTSQDPIGFQAGDANLYRYVHNGPTNNTDPSGLQNVLIYKKHPDGKTYSLYFPDGSVKPFNPGNQDIRDRLRSIYPSYTIRSQDEVVQQDGQKLAPYGAKEVLVKTDPQHIPAERVDDLLKDNLALRSTNPGLQQYVYLADVNPSGGVHALVLAPSGLGDYQVVFARKYPKGGEDPAVVVQRFRTPERVNEHIDTYRLGRASKEAQQWADGVTFAYHLVPFGAAWDNAAHGEFGEAAIALAGDAAFFLSGPLAGAAKTTRSAKALRLVGAGVEGTIGATRATQGYFALRAGDEGKAAGYFGEATLRLLGMSKDAIAALKKAPRTSATAEMGGLLNGRLTPVGTEKVVITPAWDTFSAASRRADATRHADRIRLLENTGKHGTPVTAPSKIAEMQALFDEMAAITRATGKEVALVQRVDDTVAMVMGEADRVALASNVKMIIAHTHPSGRLGLSSGRLVEVNPGRFVETGDVARLRQLGQETTTVIGPDGTAVRFNRSQWDPLAK